MMMVPFSLMLILATLGGAGGNELVDYLDTQSYWRVVDRANIADDALIALIAPPARGAGDAAPLIEQLDAPDFRDRERAEQALVQMGRDAMDALRKARADPRPEVSSRAESILQQIETDLAGEGIRRLMAIRTLGERKVQAAVPALRALLDSPDAFVAEHARRAIARIEGRELPTPELPAEARAKQTALLPDGLGVVGQTIMPCAGVGVGIREMVQPMVEAFGGQDIETVLDEMTGGMLEVANRTGNVRVDLVTFGFSGDVTNSPHMIILVQGQWNAEAVGAVLTENVEATRVVENASVYQMSRDAVLVIASDTQAALVASDGEIDPIVSSVARAIRTGEGGFAGSDLAKLVRPEHASADTWVLARMTESYKQQEEFFQAFEDMWVTVHRRDGKARIIGEARGTDREAVEQRLVQIKAGVDEALGQVRQVAQNLPQAKPALELLESLKIDMDGTTIRASAELEGDPRMILGTMMMGMPMRARAVPPPDVEAVPAQIEPVEPAPQPVEPDR